MSDGPMPQRAVICLLCLGGAMLLCLPSASAVPFRPLQPAAFSYIYPVNLTNNRPRLFFGVAQRLPGVDPTNKEWPFPDVSHVTYPGFRLIWDIFAATNAAVRKINNDGILFPNHTLSYIIYDPQGDTTTQMQSFMMTVDPAHSQAPTVEFVMGFVEGAQALVGSGLGKIYNIPVYTEWVQSTDLIDPSLALPQSYPPLTIAIPGTPEYAAMAYPTFSRSSYSTAVHGVSIAKLMFDVLKWRNFAILYNENDAASATQCAASSHYMTSRGATQIINVAVRFPALDVRYNFTDGSLYNYVDPSFLPVMDEALGRIKAIENLRVILFCGQWFAATDALLPRAIRLNMIGKHTRFLWVGNSDWAFDADLAKRFSPYVNGMLGTKRRVPIDGPGTSFFLNEWTAAYNENPDNTFRIPAPLRPDVSLRYDAAVFTARLLSKANQVFDYCNNTMSSVIAAAPPVVNLANNLTGCLKMVQTQPLAPPADEWLPLCCVLEQAWIPNPRGSVILQVLRNISHAGIAGNISFNFRGEATGDAVVYLYHDETLPYPFEWGEFSLATNGTLESGFVIADPSLIKFPDGTNNIPSDTVDRVAHRRIPNDGAIGFVLAWCVASVIGLVLLVRYIENHKAHEVITHNLRLNYLIILGCLMLIIAGILVICRNFIENATMYGNTCSAAMWLQTLGTTLIFASIAMRTYRLYRIMYKPTDPSTGNLHDSTLLTYVAVLVIIAVIIMIVWSIVEPFELEITRIERGDSIDLPVGATFVPRVIDTVVYECATNNSYVFNITFYLYYAAIMWIAVFHSVSLQKKWYEYDDTFESFVSVFTSIIFSILILAIGTSASSGEVDLLAIIFGWFPVLSADIIVVAIFFRPIRSILRGESRTRGTPLVRNGSSVPIASSSPIPLGSIGHATPAPVPQQPSDQQMLV